MTMNSEPMYKADMKTATAAQRVEEYGESQLVSVAAPDVSVVMPVYNRRKMAVRAVRSLLNQDTDVSYEIVVVDDGSTDGTAEAVRQLDSRVRVISQQNQGAAVARHIGAMESRAPIIIFHDSDDLANSGKIRELYTALRTNPGCVVAYAIVVDEYGIPLQPDHVLRSVATGETCEVKDPFVRLLGSGGPIAAGMGFATYRSLARICSAGRSFYRGANDYDLQLRLAWHGNFVFKAAVIQECTLFDDGISYNVGRTRQRAFALHAADEAYRRSRRQDVPARNAIRERMAKDWPRAVVGAALLGEWELVRHILAFGPRYLRWRRFPRRLLRAFQWLVHQEPGNAPKGLPTKLLQLAVRAELKKRKKRARRVQEDAAIGDVFDGASFHGAWDNKSAGFRPIDKP